MCDLTPIHLAEVLVVFCTEMFLLLTVLLYWTVVLFNYTVVHKNVAINICQ